MRSKFSQRWWLIVAAIAFVSVLAAHSAELSAINVPNSVVAQSGSTDIQPTDNESEQEQLTHTPNRGAVSFADVEMEHRFNELRRELLDSREKMVDWWLAAIAIFLTSLGVIAAIVGFFGFKSLRRIEKEAHKSMEAAKKHAEEAKNYVQETKRSRDEADSLVQEINAEFVSDDLTIPQNKVSEVVANIQHNPDPLPIDKEVAAAFLLQQQNKIEEAIKKWTSIANILEGIDNERTAEAWFSVGYLISSKNNDSERAIEAYDKSIELNPNLYTTYNNRGNEKNNLGQYESAITDFDKALTLNPDSAAAYNNRGRANAKLNQYESAIADFNKAIALKPNNAAAYNNRGSAKFDLGQYNSAIADYDTALDLKSDHTKAYRNRGVVKLKLGKYESAIADYNAALALNPNDAKSYYNRGVAKFNLSQYEPAIADYDKALALKPDDAKIYCSRGVAKAKLRCTDEAQKDLRKGYNLAQATGNTDLAELVALRLAILDRGDIP